MIIKYILNILIATDQWFNTLLLGSPDETISSRLWRNYPNSLAYKFVNLLFFWESNHCDAHIENIEDSEDAIIK